VTCLRCGGCRLALPGCWAPRIVRHWPRGAEADVPDGESPSERMALACFFRGASRRAPGAPAKAALYPLNRFCAARERVCTLADRASCVGVAPGPRMFSACVAHNC